MGLFSVLRIQYAWIFKLVARSRAEVLGRMEGVRLRAPMKRFTED